MAGKIVDREGNISAQRLADFRNDYASVIDLFPGLKQDLEDVAMTQARLKEVTSGEVTRENQVDRYINNFFKNLTGENVAVSFGDILSKLFALRKCSTTLSKASQTKFIAFLLLSVRLI